MVCQCVKDGFMLNTEIKGNVENLALYSCLGVCNFRSVLYLCSITGRNCASVKQEL